MTRRSGAIPFGRLLAEFAVIVIGVLVALLTESWWQERGERREEREALVRIHDEIVADSLRLQRTGLWLDFVIPAADRVPEILTGRDTLPLTGQLALLYAAATVNQTGYLFWTWDELRETGRTGLIRDPEVRASLVRYFAASADLEEGRNGLPDTSRAMTVGLMPSAFANRILNRCLRAEAVPDAGPREDALAGLEACTERPGVDPATLLARLRGQDGLAIEAGRLAYELTQLRGNLSLMRAQRDSTLAVLEARRSGGAP
ncbi:MAG: hypothetical protein R3266_13255 [Gemmatimonadota bacterium]|nr:hypothetical protein [Gemmatimonadota bacterium]